MMIEPHAAALLAYIRSLGSLAADQRPKFSVDGLAVLARLPRQACQQALLDLSRQGLLEVRVHASGRFELLPSESTRILS